MSRDGQLLATLITNPKGEYRSGQLPPGPVRVEGEVEGFATAVAHTIIRPGQSRRQNLMMRPGTAEPPPPPPPPPPKPPEGEEGDVPEKPKYKLRGTEIRVPFMKKLPDAYDVLTEQWRRAQVHREWLKQVRPDVYAVGGPLDPGERLPASALRSKAAFTEWATHEGYSEGLSLRIDGINPPPGQSAIPKQKGGDE